VLAFVVFRFIYFVFSIYSYAKMHNTGLLGGLPFFVPLSALLWVWDEFDDFQDGYSRIQNSAEPPDIMDTLEL